MNNLFFFQVFRGILVISVFVLCLVIIKWVFYYTYPFLIAFIISAFAQPFLTFFQKQFHLSRLLATLIFLLINIIIIIAVGLLLLSELMNGFAFLTDIIPHYFRQLILTMEQLFQYYLVPIYHKIFQSLQTMPPETQIVLEEQIQQIAQNSAESGATLIQAVLLKIPSILIFLPTSLISFILILLASFFMIKDWEKLKDKLTQIVPARFNNFRLLFMKHFKNVLLGYVKAQSLLITISTCIIFIGLIFLQVEHALTITLLTALADLLPLIGTGIIFIPWILFLFFTGNYPLTIGIAIIYGITVISRQLLEPKIMSDKIGVHPLFTLFILFLMFQLWGANGVILTPGILIIFVVCKESGLFLFIWRFIKGTTNDGK